MPAPSTITGSPGSRPAVSAPWIAHAAGSIMTAASSVMSAGTASDVVTLQDVFTSGACLDSRQSGDFSIDPASTDAVGIMRNQDGTCWTPTCTPSRRTVPTGNTP